MTPIEGLLAVSAAFAEARKLSESRVSTIVFNDGKRLAAVRAGSDIGGRLIERGLNWFAANWPDGAEWPAGVARPEPRSGEEPSSNNTDAACERVMG